MSTAAFAAEEGSWTLMPAEEAGKVHFTVLQRHERGIRTAGPTGP